MMSNPAVAKVSVLNLKFDSIEYVDKWVEFAPKMKGFTRYHQDRSGRHTLRYEYPSNELINTVKMYISTRDPQHFSWSSENFNFFNNFTEKKDANTDKEKKVIFVTIMLDSFDYPEIGSGERWSQLVNRFRHIVDSYSRLDPYFWGRGELIDTAKDVVVVFQLRDSKTVSDMTRKIREAFGENARRFSVMSSERITFKRTGE